MNPTTSELLRQGLIITVLAVTLVFASLGLLWGIIALLMRLFKDAPEKPASHGDATSRGEAAMPAALMASASADALTAERARVAAIVTGALIANAVPLLMEAPVGPAFEHGRTAPNWVTGNRARALQSWQPPRRPRD